MFPGINQDDRPCDRFIPTNVDRFEKKDILIAIRGGIFRHLIVSET
jgi:hypothetical protein